MQVSRDTILALLTVVLGVVLYHRQALPTLTLTLTTRPSPSPSPSPSPNPSAPDSDPNPDH